MTGFLLCLLFASAWTVRAYLWPMSPCRKCHGTKVNPGSNKKRFGACRACKGSGARWVFGARTVHKAVRSLRLYRRKQKGMK